jgi:hypothetical protein
VESFAVRHVPVPVAAIPRQIVRRWPKYGDVQFVEEVVFLTPSLKKRRPGAVVSNQGAVSATVNATNLEYNVGRGAVASTAGIKYL